MKRMFVNLFLLNVFLFVNFSSGEVLIKYFDAFVMIPSVGNFSTVGSDYIEMWAQVFQCPTTGCSCQIDPNARPLTFPATSPSLASMNFSNLQPVTSYTFVLTCQGAPERVERTVRTDVGVPSVPEQLDASLNEDQRIVAHWTRPSRPAGPIDLYRVFFDGNRTLIELKNDQFSFEIPEKYVYGVRREIFVSACNIDQKSIKRCSSANDGKIEFYLPETTTTPKNSASSAFFFSKLFLFGFYLFSSKFF